MGISNSPFESYLGTNLVPTPSEIHNIRNLLDDYNIQLLGLKGETSRLQKKCAKLRHRIAAHQALISPARRLPFDIIQEIFVHCLPSAHDGNAEMKASQAPLLLGRICGAWRSISLSTPALWDSIHIIVPAMPPRNDSNPSQVRFHEQRRMTNLLAQAVEDWLERSETRPLSISLMQFYNYKFDKDTPLSYPLFNLLLRYCRRWQNIEIKADCLSVEALVGELANCGITNSVPWLASLKLYGPMHPGKVGGLPFIAPKLYKMAFSWVGNFTGIHVPWHQLTELVLDLFHLYIPSEFRAADLFSACRRLEKLHLKIHHYSAIHLSLPFLKSFVLFDNHHNTTIFVSGHHLPALRHLAFRAIYPERKLLALLHPFGGQLETLCLSANICIKFEALKYLHLTPRLIHLRIEKSAFFDIGPLAGKNLDASPPHISYQFLNLLDARYTDKVCPLLEALYLMDGASFTDQQLLDFILSRRGLSHLAGVSKLKHMSVVLHRDREIDIAKQLSDLGEDEGLTLRLLYGPKILAA